MTFILSETFFVLFRVALEIQQESYGSRHASVVLRYNIVHAYNILQICTYIAICTQLRLTTKLTYLMTIYMYYTPNGGFTVNNSSFYKNKVG